MFFKKLSLILPLALAITACSGKKGSAPAVAQQAPLTAPKAQAAPTAKPAPTTTPTTGPTSRPTSRPTSGPSTTQACVERRAAFDVGSASTKIVVADVNTCTHQIDRVLWKDSVKVAYQSDYVASKDKKSFSDAIMTEGASAFKSLASKASNFHPVSYSGVATSAFRKAKNGKSFVDKVNGDLNLHITVVSQDEEGRLGFVAAANTLKVAREHLVVWDVGGSSLQLTMAKGEHDVTVFKSQFASEPFRDFVITDIQQADLTQKKSPNPINSDESTKALKRVTTEAAKVPADFTKKIADPKTVVVGVGPLHNASIGGQTNNKDSYTADNVAAALKNQLDQKDDQVGGGSYSNTQVSNLILVQGYMQQLKISTVKLVDVNNANAVLVEDSYWKTN